MICRIFCDKCKDKLPMNPLDEADGWRQRRVPMFARKPVEHKLTIRNIDTGETETEDIPTLICDSCGVSIPDGSLVVAITMWRGPEPGTWEADFMAAAPCQTDPRSEGSSQKS